MKKLFIILVVALVCLPYIKISAQAASDTIIVLENRKVEVKEVEGRTKVRVFEINEKNDSVVETNIVYEGSYTDVESREKINYTRKVELTIPSWDRFFNPHWAGIGIGFGSFVGGDSKDVVLRSSKSLEYNFNFFEKAYPFYKNRMALVTGAGVRLNRYRLAENKSFEEIDGVTTLVDAPSGVFYQNSKLNTNSITLPLLVEYQLRKNKKTRFFVSAGVVGVVNFYSNSVVDYVDATGKKQKEKIESNLNVRPISMDILAQAGFDMFGIYLKYTPIGVFEKDKGPKLNPFSIGLQLNL